MTDPKNHHYVDQAILREFLSPNLPPDKAKLAVYDRKFDKFYERSTRSVASDQYLYTISGAPDGSGRAEIEHLLQQVLDGALPGLIKLRLGKPISYDDKAKIAFFLGVQWARTPESLVTASALNKVQNEAAAKEIARSFGLGNDALSHLVDEIRGGTALAIDGVPISGPSDYERLQMLEVGKALGKTFEMRAWAVSHAGPEDRFILGDYPLTQMKFGATDLVRQPGPRAPGAVNSMPIGAHAAIQVMPFIGKLKHMKADAFHVRVLNDLEATHSRRWIFGATRDDLKRVIEDVDLPNRPIEEFEISTEKIEADTRAALRASHRGDNN